MQTYISFLRGINVSGQKKILMADLKTLYEKLLFMNVITYIQSGNVVFDSDSELSNEQLSQVIGKAILSQYGFEIPVIIRNLTELKIIIAQNPFPNVQNINPERLYVTFLSELPSEARLEKIQSMELSTDKFVYIGKEIFLYCPISYGETKLSNNFFESKLKVTATTRNWKTVLKLVEIAAT